MCYGDEVNVSIHQEKIAKIPLPEMDPVAGKDGPLTQHWKEG